MMIYYSPTLISSLGNKTLFLDTSSLVAALAFIDEFGKLFDELKKAGCDFLTIPSVLFEFTRGVDSITSFNSRREFVTKTLGTGIYPIEKTLEDLEELIVVLQHVSGNMSYTDFLLCACLYRFSNSYVLTENHKDFPCELLNRDFIITIDAGDRQIRNLAVYSFSKEKFASAAENILKIS